MKKYDPQMGNPGPHDPELVDLLLKHFVEVDEEKLNVIIDEINEIFYEFLFHDKLFHQSTRTRH